MKRPRGYGDAWDEYVGRWRVFARREPRKSPEARLRYPGDEWGDEAAWDAYADRFLVRYLPADGRGLAVEIGPGSGKYTERVLDRVSRLLCLDVSRRFLEICRKRFAEQIGSGRLAFELLRQQDHGEMRAVLERHGLSGKADLVFSVDSMQHVELHTLIAYLLAAASALRIGGHLSLTLATCGTVQGFQRLLAEMPTYYGNRQGGHQFYFLSREAATSILTRLGFEIEDYREWRDIDLAARKVREADLPPPQL